MLKKFFVCFLLIISSVFASCAPARSQYAFYAMGSYVSATAYNGDIGDELQDRIVALEMIISSREKSSVVAKLNDKHICEDATLAGIVSQALEICRQTGGKYDISLYRLTSLWDFNSKSPAPPVDSAVTEALAHCGYKNVSVEENIVRLSGDVEIDLGSLGKGLACDEAAKLFAEKNLCGIVSVGGSICLAGKKPGDADFEIGIRDPFSENSSDCIARLKLSDTFVSTSGSYEKKFSYNDKEYHHILDSATGYPVENDLVSVTVVAKSGMLSDALSTAAFCLGRNDAKVLLTYYNASAVFVCKDGSIYASRELEGKLSAVSSGTTVIYD